MLTESMAQHSVDNGCTPEIRMLLVNKAVLFIRMIQVYRFITLSFLYS